MGIWLSLFEVGVEEKVMERNEDGMVVYGIFSCIFVKGFELKLFRS